MSGTKPVSAFVTDGGAALTKAELEMELKQAIAKVLPTDYDHYREVNVLAVHWSDPKWVTLEDELMTTFRDVYGFRTSTFVIDVKRNYDVTSDLRDRVIRFVKDGDRPKALGIIVYSGHAETNLKAPAPQLHLGAELVSEQLKGPFINWTRHASMTDTFKGGEVLLVMDCCFAAQAIRTNKGPELLAASGWEAQASAHVDSCLTAALNTILKELNGQTCKVADVYAKILHGKKHYGLTTTPVHALTLNSKAQSITLERLSGKQPTGRSVNVSNSSSHINDRVILSVHL
ncbi:unnamed protein product [Aureobasidium uvarum]|uniref:Caspase domain-containing protein n=1 Tax=Aureobasidium uvarum TaxID=2773716 RepID=A0A9N8KEA0_9PEZI|nr:unnamed protein product [Aureobasidium uvarum]